MSRLAFKLMVFSVAYWPAEQTLVFKGPGFDSQLEIRGFWTIKYLMKHFYIATQTGSSSLFNMPLALRGEMCTSYMLI